RPAEHARGVVEIAPRDRVTHARARPPAALVAGERVRARLEAVLLAEEGEIRVRAHAILAEAEIVADDHDLRRERGDERALDELERRARGERAIEAAHEDRERGIDAPDELELAIERCEDGWHRPAEHGARVRREGEHGGIEATPARVLCDGGEHGL